MREERCGEKNSEVVKRTAAVMRRAAPTVREECSGEKNSAVVRRADAVVRRAAAMVRRTAQW